MTGPFYPLVAHDGPNAQRQILVDVTQSSPSFLDANGELKRVLKEILRNSELGIKDVVEFGAGKLKNVNFVLQQGKNVCAVEFEKLMSNPIAVRNLSKARNYGSHFRLLDPSEFFNDTQKFDLALLINVVSTMPIAAERLQVLKALNERLNDRKFLLWYAQKGRLEYAYNKRKAEGKTYGDVIWLGEGRRVQTVYKYFTPEEMTALAHEAGFVPFDRFRPLRNDALLFRK